MEHTQPEARTRVRERRGPETRSQVVRRSVESRNLDHKYRTLVFRIV